MLEKSVMNLASALESLEKRLSSHMREHVSSRENMDDALLQTKIAQSNTARASKELSAAIEELGALMADTGAQTSAQSAEDDAQAQTKS